MSKENVEIVRAMGKAFNEGDWTGALGCLSPEIEYHELAGMPGAGEGAGVYRGVQELVQWYSEFLSQWEAGFISEQERVIEVGDDHVITMENWRGRGAKSGIAVEMSAVGLHTIHNGRITCMRYFRTEAEAIAAVEQKN